MLFKPITGLVSTSLYETENLYQIVSWNPCLEDGHTKETKKGGLSTFTNLSLVRPVGAKESQEEIRNKNKLTDPMPRRMCCTTGQKPGRTSQQQIKIKNQQEGGTNVQALLP